MAAENMVLKISQTEQSLIVVPTGGRKRVSSAFPFSLFMFSQITIAVASIIGTSSAFVLPDTSPKSILFAPKSTLSNSHSIARNRGSIRSMRRTVSSLSTSLCATVPTDSEELTDVAHHGFDIGPVPVEPPKSNATLLDIPATLSDIPKLGGDLSPEEMKMDESKELTDGTHHMINGSGLPSDNVTVPKIRDNMEELTHLPAHDEADLQELLFPSVPVSFDEYGLVQAEAVSSSNAIALIEANDITNAAAPAIADNGPDYPSLVKYLFTKDANGQTLASKLVNLVLLCVSFGYAAASVFHIDAGMTRGWSQAEIAMRIPLDTWASYENSLSEKPVATKTIINIVIYLLGDWLSQTLFTGKNVLDFDAGRTLKNGFVGMCFGPAVHEYYEFSDWILPVEGATWGVTNRAFKILMDQTAYLSIKCSIYILAIGVLNGEGLGESSENVKNRIKPIMFTAWKFWPLVHCVTYGLIPARHRILWVNSVDLVWNAILASKARDDDDVEGDDDGAATQALTEEMPKKEGSTGALEAMAQAGLGCERGGDGTTPEANGASGAGTQLLLKQ
eukprot:CAMPEP_0172551696 /NCGR_PEP_ID=MMETSP1067-20121228/40148_1 /TAXON_ID=265564 ORGANISM="Thalassiosira punctigera, Strain Tpunct2005C2" /NCGR_SAMPLE_ID=MMETSP1067 /ASSEMBLY_ACC=CAM_ASM_000444 /LENGTH=561 /DNA_ID=CAMNT_0013339507 /DNA_START=211 /DNA_END=1897 /DNA_ORIENTATION=+